MSEPTADTVSADDEWSCGFRLGVRYSHDVRVCAFVLRAHAPSWPTERLRGFLDGAAHRASASPRDVAPDDAN